MILYFKTFTIVGNQNYQFSVKKKKKSNNYPSQVNYLQFTKWGGGQNRVISVPNSTALKLNILTLLTIISVNTSEKQVSHLPKFKN